MIPDSGEVKNTEGMLLWAVTQPKLIEELLQDSDVMLKLGEIAHDAWIDECSKEEGLGYFATGFVTRGEYEFYDCPQDVDQMEEEPSRVWRNGDFYEEALQYENGLWLNVGEIRAPDGSLHMFSAFRLATREEEKILLKGDK